MKTEEKELVVKWLDKLSKYSKVNSMEYWIEKFKADNDLLPKPKLEFNRWIVNDEKKDWLVYYDRVNSLIYGIKQDIGTWFCNELNHNPNDYELNRYANKEEILEKLSAMAKKMGYIEGVEVDSFVEGYKDTLAGSFSITEHGIWADGKTYGILIMEYGKWANIISTPNRELSKEEWYERIGIDKHIEAITKQGYLVTLEKK